MKRGHALSISLVIAAAASVGARRRGSHVPGRATRPGGDRSRAAEIAAPEPAPRLQRPS